jgi:hypothetical protein
MPSIPVIILILTLNKCCSFSKFSFTLMKTFLLNLFFKFSMIRCPLTVLSILTELSLVTDCHLLMTKCLIVHIENWLSFCSSNITPSALPWLDSLEVALLLTNCQWYLSTSELTSKPSHCFNYQRILRIVKPSSQCLRSAHLFIWKPFYYYNKIS